MVSMRSIQKDLKKLYKIKRNENMDTSDTVADMKLALSNDEKRDEFFFTLIKSYNNDI